MSAETAREFAALEAQAQRIMAVFTADGYEAVAPAILQPAGVFLDAVGEQLRARTYVFTDRNGAELCLRPDLTVPTCRLHIERSASAGDAARYCYNGPAFRFQPADADAAHPREFRQAGIENIGATDPTAAEADVLSLIVQALAATGIDRKELTLRFGDLALIRAVLDAVDMPQAGRLRLLARFGRSSAFKAELARMTEGAPEPPVHLPDGLIAALEGVPPSDIPAHLVAHLEAHGIEAVGARSVAEVADGIAAMLDHRRAKPLSRASADLINGYVAVDTPCPQAANAIHALGRTHRINLDRPLAAFTARLDALAARRIDLASASFAGSFGRALGYYTGFVFEIGGPGLGINSPLAGGGRYDGLMRAAGSPVDVPAIGAAIHTERLLAAIQERAQ